MKKIGRPQFGHSDKQRKNSHQIKLWLRERKDRSRPGYAEVAAKCNAERMAAPGGGLWTGRSIKAVAERKHGPAKPKRIVKRNLDPDDYLNATQIGMCLRACSGKDGLVFETLLATGLRPKIEFCELQIRDVKVEQGQRAIVVRKGKGRVARTVAIDEQLAGWLRAYLGNGRSRAGLTDPLFLNTQNKALKYKTLHGWLRELGKAAGLSGRLKPYRCRHSFASLLHENKKDLNFIAEQMGHRSIETTRRYVHTAETSKTDQMNAMRSAIEAARSSENPR